MEPGGRALDDAGAAPDPNNLIVGTIELPAWLGRIPALAWLFIGLAVFDAGFRIWTGLDRGVDLSAVGVIYLVLSIVRSAAIVLLPAAMLIGRKGFGRGESWMLQGALALVLAELVGLIGPHVARAVVEQQILDPGAADTFSTQLVIQSMVVSVPVAILTFFGLAKIGLGFGAIQDPDRPIGRTVVAILGASIAAILVGAALTVQSLASSAQDAVVVAYNLLVVAIGLVLAGLWAWVATVTDRREGRSWQQLTGGAVAPVLVAAIGSAGLLVALQEAGTDGALTIVTWFGIAAVAVGAAGATLLLVGFGNGFDPTDEADQADQTDETADALDDEPGAVPGSLEG